MKTEADKVQCTHCLKIWDKNELSRSCSNCFACTGCEAYNCPECRYEIVVKPPKTIKKETSGKDIS